MTLWKAMLASVVALAAAASGPVPAWADRYDLHLVLRVPVVEGNGESLGRRVYRTQSLRGTLVAYYYDEASDPYVAVTGLHNRNHKVRGSCVTYSAKVSDVLWRAVGDNRTGVFKRAAFGFRLEADPSYNVGGDEPDNTLLLTLAGDGMTPSSVVSGYASGQLGCGCRAYGHVSPTRVVYRPYVGERWPAPPRGKWRYCTVADVAPCWGRWSVAFRERSYAADISPCLAR